MKGLDCIVGSMPHASFKHSAVYWAGDQGPVSPPSGGWVCAWWREHLRLLTSPIAMSDALRPQGCTRPGRVGTTRSARPSGERAVGALGRGGSGRCRGRPARWRARGASRRQQVGVCWFDDGLETARPAMPRRCSGCLTSYRLRGPPNSACSSHSPFSGGGARRDQGMIAQAKSNGGGAPPATGSTEIAHQLLSPLVDPRPNAQNCRLREGRHRRNGATDMPTTLPSKCDLVDHTAKA
jgi:hypothetical protein